MPWRAAAKMVVTWGITNGGMSKTVAVWFFCNNFWVQNKLTTLSLQQTCSAWFDIQANIVSPGPTSSSYKPCAKAVECRCKIVAKQTRVWDTLCNFGWEWCEHTVVVWRLVMEALLLLVVRKGWEVFDDGVDPHMWIFNDDIITSRSATVQRSSWCLELRIVRCGSCSFLSSSSAGRVLAARVVNQQPAALRNK